MLLWNYVSRAPMVFLGTGALVPAWSEAERFFKPVPSCLPLPTPRAAIPKLICMLTTTFPRCSPECCLSLATLLSQGPSVNEIKCNLLFAVSGLITSVVVIPGLLVTVSRWWC